MADESDTQRTATPPFHEPLEAASPREHEHSQEGHRTRPDYVVKRRIGIPGVFEIEVGLTGEQLGIIKDEALEACKAMYERWKENHHHTEQNPIRMCENHEQVSPLVNDQRSASPEVNNRH